MEPTRLVPPSESEPELQPHMEEIGSPIDEAFGEFFAEASKKRITEDGPDKAGHPFRYIVQEVRTVVFSFASSC